MALDAFFFFLTAVDSLRTNERLMSGLSVIDDTCHQKAKKKGDTWEPCVTPLKKDQVVDKDRSRKR